MHQWLTISLLIIFCNSFIFTYFVDAARSNIKVKNKIALSSHQAQVKRAGMKVMPFNVYKINHYFLPNPSGGLMHVDATSNDKTSITLIRKHLSEVARGFAKGDYTDPIKNHGENMSVLSTLVKDAQKNECNLLRYS